MKARVAYLAGLLPESRPHGAPLVRPPRRLFTPDLPFVPGTPGDAAAPSATAQPSNLDAIAPGRPSASGGASDALTAGATVDTSRAAGVLARAGSAPLLHEGSRPLTGPDAMRAQSRDWTPRGQPQMGAFPSGTTTAGAAPSAGTGHDRAPASHGAQSAGSHLRHASGPALQAASRAPFAAQSATPRAPGAAHELSAPAIATAEGIARLRSAAHSPSGDRSPHAPGTHEPGAHEQDARGATPLTGELTEPTAAPTRGAPSKPPAAGSPGLLQPHAGTQRGPIASEPAAHAELLAPAPVPERRGPRTPSAYDSLAGGAHERRAAPARVSIGTIEVTVLPPPAPAPPPPASVARPAESPSARPPAGSTQPVADRLRLGERRWYGMAQA
jgi:hypothetical protein